MKRYLKLGGLVALLAAPSPGNAQVTYSYTGPPVPVPDNVPAGVNLDITVPNSGALSAITVTLNFNPTAGGLAHTWTGDLVATLTHVPTNTTSDLFRRVQVATLPSTGGTQDDFAGPYIFSDAATIRLADHVGNPIPTGSYRATNNIFNGDTSAAFSGEQIQSLNTNFGGVGNINGIWRLNLSDHAAQDTGTIGAFSITITVVPEPTSLILVGVGVGGLTLKLRRRKTS